MGKCVLIAKRGHKKRRRDSKSKAAAMASRAHDQLACTIALLIAHWAATSNSPVVLENLRGMFGGWPKQKGMFGKGLRRKPYSAAIMKMSGKIWDAARPCGVEAGRMSPRHTQNCARHAGTSPPGDHTGESAATVDPAQMETSTLENTRRTSAAARYGPLVRAGLGEARRGADIILDPASLAHGRLVICG